MDANQRLSGLTLQLDWLRYMFYIVYMGSRDRLGEFEQLVLLAILRLGTEAYGLAVQQEIQRCTDRSCSIGAVYTTLDRMELKGLVTSWMGDPTPQRGGRAKKFFKLQGAGQAALKRSHAEVHAMQTGVAASYGVS